MADMTRPVFLTLLLILCGSPLFSQIAVKSFDLLPNDLDARAHYPREDKNGEKAALIKVVTTERGFEFEAGTIGIVATEQKTAEIWLYVPRGSKTLTIKHPQLGVLRGYNYPVSIEAGTVYEMTLVSGRVEMVVKPAETETQWLIISSEPTGADLYLNDQASGKTPYQNELPVGRYTWRLTKELYLNEAGVVELTAGSEKKKVNVVLKPDFGTLKITSSPESGAAVSLNGIATGKVTPCDLERVPSGNHTLTVTRDMYETATQRFTLTAGETKPVAFTLNPTFAEVALTTNPVADIYINGEFKANATWKGRLNPGVYTFEARLDKHTPATEKRSVAVGQPVSLKLSPIPKTGSLRVVTNPFDATIRLNGKEVGTTPMTLKNQLIGEYTLELSLTGYATATQKVTIAEGETAEVNITLENGMPVEITGAPANAALFIDNTPAGNLPYIGNLIFGRHTLRIESDGKKAEKEITLVQGGTSNFNLTLSSNLTENFAGMEMEMVFVKGGSFDMGSNNGSEDEKPVHRITLDDFYVGKTEVTQAQWSAITGSNPSSFKNCDQCPVESVSWNNVQDFIRKLNQKTGKKYRLPTEAEWEYAARGGQQSKGYKYSGCNSLGDVGWYSHNSDSKTHQVGQKKANELGLHDMSGNVWEWCSDWYGSDYYSQSPSRNPTGPAPGSSRVSRGGGWGDGADDCRSSNRSYSNPCYRISDLGFRLVLCP
jgi:formylglycine-generating enzyme required for sulfatase activity